MLKRLLLIGMSIIFMLTTVLVPFSVNAASGTTYYVDAVNGSDTEGDGSSGNPWKTIGKAASVMAAGDTCKIRSGIYRETVTPSNSGADGAYITFEADNGADVTISGADLITSEWESVGESVYKTTANLVMGDWKNQVFVDGVAMNLARYPNAGTDPMNPVFLSADTGTNNSTIKDSELTQPDGYWNGAAVIVMDKWRWAIASTTVSSYVTGQLNLGSISTYGLGVETGDGVPYGSPYYIIGKLEALDSENEWYYDKNSNELSLGIDPTGHTVEVKARTNAFNLKGKNYIRVKGINLFAATIDAGNSNYCEIDGINGKYLSHYELTFTGSEQNYKTSGINIGGNNNVLKNSTLAYSPGNLVSVAGENNKIINNLMHDSTYGPFYACEAACIYNVGKGTLISHNTLYNSGRSVISGSPDNCRIQYNKAWNAMMLLDDGGFVYHATTDGRGTEYHHNIFLNGKANPPHFMSGGIYLDQGSVDFKIYNNVISGVNKFGIFFHHYNMFTQAYNNTLYNKSWFRMKDDRSSVDGYGTRVINNISYDTFKVADEFGIRAANNFTSGDPLFVNPAEEDFRLQESSPAIDAGLEVEGLTGSNPDIGAYEYGEEAWTAGHDFSNPPNPTFDTVTLPYENLLKNGFFERDNEIFGGWTKTYGKTASMIRDAGDASIARFAYTRGVKLGTGVDGIEQIVTGLEPNTEYELRGFGRMGDENQKLRIGVKNHGGAEAYSEISSTKWTKGKVRFTTGPASTSATVSIYKTTVGNFAYADDVTLVKADPAAPAEIEPAVEEEPPLAPNTIRINDHTMGTGNYQFHFVGTWGTSTTNNVCYKRDNHWTNTVDSYYDFKFYGVKIDLFSEVANNFGICAVSVDDGPEEMIDTYSEVNESKIVYTKDGLEPGVLHTLKVRVTGNKNPDSKGTYHVADRIEVEYDPSDIDKLPGNEDEEEPEPPVVKFTEDFESDTVGQAPEGWTITDVDGDSSTNIITVQTAANSSNPNNKAIKLKRAADGNSLSALTTIEEPVSGVVTIDLRVMAPQTNGLAYALMVKDSAGKDVVSFGPQANGKFGIIKKSTAWQDLSAYSANGWYDIQIVCDTGKDTYDLSIDGKLELVGEPMRNTVDNISQLLVSAYSWANVTVYVDDILVRTGTTWSSLSDALLTYDNDNPDKKDLELKITLSGNNLKDITDASGKKLKRGKDYAITGNKVAISKDYLKTLEAGDYNFTFDIDRGADPMLIVTVSGTPTPVEQVAAIDPQEQTYDRNPSVDNDVIVTMDPDGLGFNGITFGSGTVLAASNYTYNPANDTVTFNRSYLDRLQEGEHAFTFDFGMENNPVLTVEVVDTRPVTILFNEDFENGTDQAPVSDIGWTDNCVPGSGYAKVIAQSNPANKVVKVERTKADANEVHIRKKFTQTSGVVTIDARIMAAQTDQLIYALMVKNNANTNGIIVGFNNNGKLAVQNRLSAWKDLSVSYAADRWYDIRIVVDTATNKYDLYVDGVQEIFGDDTRTVIADVAEVVISVNKSEKTGAIYLDDLLVRTGSVNSKLISGTAASFDKNPAQQTDVAADVNTKGNKLRELKDSLGQAVDSEYYGMNGNTLTISKDYLAGLENGEYTFVLDFNYGADLLLTVNVVDTTSAEEPEATITPTELTYDRNPEVESGLEVTLDPDGLTFNGITYGEGTVLNASNYTVTGNVVAFKPEYLNTLETGSHEFTFDFGMEANPVLTINIVDTTPAEEPETPDFEIAAPVIRDAAGNTITALANSLVVDVAVSAVNNSTEGKNAVLVVALYDSGNTMRNFSKATQTVAAGGTVQLTAGFKLPEDVTGYYMKVFVLDGLDTEGDINLLSEIITIQ